MKKGAITLIPKEIWGVIRGAALILIISFVFMKIFFFVNPAYAVSKSTLERLGGATNVLESGESRSVNLNLERGIWLFGFNKDQEFITYQRTDYGVLRRRLAQPKPQGCALGEACLCLCTGDCNKFANCKPFEDINYFVATDIPAGINGGISYEEGGPEGNYLAMPGQGIIVLELWREGDIIYIGQEKPEQDTAREEFQRLIDFAENIGVMYAGTCKMIHEIDTAKLTDEYYITVYEDGRMKLFSGEPGQARVVATASINPAPILSFDFNDIDELFEDYDRLTRIDFVIDPHGSGGDYGLVEGIYGENKVALLQRRGTWLWAKVDSYLSGPNVNNC